VCERERAGERERMCVREGACARDGVREREGGGERENLKALPRELPAEKVDEHVHQPLVQSFRVQCLELGVGKLGFRV
jgi:hypothetical protein